MSLTSCLVTYVLIWGHLALRSESLNPTKQSGKGIIPSGPFPKSVQGSEEGTEVSPTGYLLLDMWSPEAYFWASFKTLTYWESDKDWLNITMVSFHINKKPKESIEMYLYICLEHLYSFQGVAWSILVLRGNEGSIHSRPVDRCKLYNNISIAPIFP